MAEIITRDSEEFKELTGWIRRCGKALENATARIRPGIADEHYLTGEEVCEKLHVSRRTLQALRDEKAIPYTSITAAGGKLLPEQSHKGVIIVPETKIAVVDTFGCHQAVMVADILVMPCDLGLDIVKLLVQPSGLVGFPFRPLGLGIP